MAEGYLKTIKALRYFLDKETEVECWYHYAHDYNWFIDEYISFLKRELRWANRYGKETDKLMEQLDWALNQFEKTDEV